MERTELINAIAFLDQAMDRARLLPLIPPLAALRSAALDRLAGPSADREKRLMEACRALLPLCGSEGWPLSLPGALRQVLTCLCAPGRIADGAAGRPAAAAAA